MGGLVDGWARGKRRGVYGYSSFMKKKKGKNYAIFFFAGFFLKKNSVLK
jgi:hypothetical protein